MKLIGSIWIDRALLQTEHWAALAVAWQVGMVTDFGFGQVFMISLPLNNSICHLFISKVLNHQRPSQPLANSPLYSTGLTYHFFPNEPLFPLAPCFEEILNQSLLLRCTWVRAGRNQSKLIGWIYNARLRQRQYLNLLAKSLISSGVFRPQLKMTRWSLNCRDNRLVK